MAIPQVPKFHIAGRVVTLIALPFRIDTEVDGEVWSGGIGYGVYSRLGADVWGVRFGLGAKMEDARFRSRYDAVEFLLDHGNPSGWYPADVDMDDSKPSFGAW